MNERIKPSIFSTRYYHLTILKRGVQYVIDKYLDKAQKLDTILDYGCGDKPYESFFSPYFYHYKGADIAINKNRDITIEINGKVDTADATIDVIVSTQVLEHVTDVDKYLSEAQRILKSAGLMFISTHGYWMYHPDPTDLWRWTRDGLEKTIAKNGFEIVETLGMMNLASSGLQLFQDGIQWKIPRFLRPVLSVFILLFQKIFDNGKLNNKDASVFLVVAKKI